VPQTNPLYDRVAERRFGRLVILLMSIGFLAVLAAGVTAAVTIERNEERSRWVDHTYRVERQVGIIRLSLEQMRSTRRGALLSLGSDMRRDYVAATGRLRQAIARAGDLTRDNDAQQRRIAEASALAADLDTRMTRSLDPGVDRTLAAEGERQAVADRLERLSDGMLANEQRLMTQRLASQRLNSQRLLLILAGAGLLVIAVGAGSIWVIRRYTRDLNESRAQLRRLNEDLEGAVQERTRDLQRANDEIQRFAYIVSHDLRSPLVNVMGFTAELEAAATTIDGLIARAEAQAPDIVTEDDRLAAREDLPEAIRFIRTSTQKMDRLINAILRLSREGRRTITPERLDMDAIAQGIADSLRHRTEAGGTTITIEKPLPGIVSDRLAVEQILSNLVENAVKYLQPGRPGMIAVRGRREGGRVIYEVSDNGRGVDPRDHDRIFDLFRRSGVQDQPGEGIGLAHVRAQAYRIGGTIAVDSRLGDGATFRINLPVAFTGEQKALS
jgi:signal transduction histidine kinase